MNVPRIALALLLAGSSVARPAQAEDYVSAEAAYKFALAYFENRQPDKGHAAMEAALKLTPEPNLKSRIYQIYLTSLARPAPIGKVLEAADHLLRHPHSPAEKSLNRSSLNSYLLNAGMARQAADFFEQKLKQTPDDAVSLYVLSELYERIVPNPKRAVEVSERLVKLGGDGENKRQDVRASSALAQQYVRAQRYREGAEMFEKIAPLEKRTSAWHLKEAATAWLKAGDKTRARAAALASAASKPGEERSQQLTHFWHRHLGEVLAETGDYGAAADHLEKAIATTDIEGYRRDVKGRLAEVKEKLNR